MRETGVVYVVDTRGNMESAKPRLPVAELAKCGDVWVDLGICYLVVGGGRRDVVQQ